MTVASDGSMAVTVDGLRLLPPVGVWDRTSYAQVVDHATAHRRNTATVEVREADGAVFTETVHAFSRSATRPRTEMLVSGGGFLPGEAVAVLPVTLEVAADRYGRIETLLELPTEVVEASEALLFGRTSGSVHLVVLR